jgi:hypothetical protein
MSTNVELVEREPKRHPQHCSKHDSVSSGRLRFQRHCSARYLEPDIQRYKNEWQCYVMKQKELI